MKKEISNAVKGVGNASAVGMVAISALPQENRKFIVKFLVYLFVGLLSLISTMAAFGIAVEIDKIPLSERGYATMALFLLALPQFIYTIYSIRWVVKKLFFKKK